MSRVNLNLYNDVNPETTLPGLGYKNAQIARETIRKVEQYFRDMRRRQTIPGNTPPNVKPHRTLTTSREADRYYLQQQYFRIMGMRNRAKGMVSRSKNPTKMNQAITIFDEWLHRYHERAKKRNR